MLFKLGEVGTCCLLHKKAFYYHLSYYFDNPPFNEGWQQWTGEEKRLRKAGKKKRSVNQHDLQSGTNPEPFLLRAGGGTMATEEPRSTSCWSLPPFQLIIIISIFALGGMCQLDPPQTNF